jgi:hypothetical protein
MMTMMAIGINRGQGTTNLHEDRGQDRLPDIETKTVDTIDITITIIAGTIGALLQPHKHPKNEPHIAQTAGHKALQRHQPPPTL